MLDFMLDCLAREWYVGISHWAEVFLCMQANISFGYLQQQRKRFQSALGFLHWSNCQICRGSLSATSVAPS